VIRGDIRIEHEVFRALAGCEGMYHVAAVYKMWARSAKEILEPAIEGTRASLEAARKRGVSKIVVTSSVAAVGANPRPEPMDEDFSFNLPEAETYIAAKRQAELVAMEYAQQGLAVVVVNPTGIYGPGDWKPTPSGGAIVQYLNWKLPIGFPSSAGGINVVDVDDVAAGHIAAMERGRVGERYILGGEDLTFEQLFTTLSQITGLRGPGMEASRATAMVAGRALEALARVVSFEPSITYKLARDYVGRYVWASSAKARKELGYSPRAARETLYRSVLWYLRHGYVEERAAKRIRLAPE
jgi:dihydroflavonol-4-reductase